ncbi:MAG: sensor histidine kinase [Actinomycetota bacterium]
MQALRAANPVEWFRRHPRVADGAVAALFTALALSAHLSGAVSVEGRDELDPTWWTTLIVLCGTIPLYWRRTAPLRSGLLVVTAESLALFLGIGGPTFLGSTVAIYSIGAHSVGPQRTRTVAAIVVIILGLFVSGWIDQLDLIDQFVSTTIVLVTTYVVGDNLRRRRENIAQLAERAERAEREQELLAEQRVLAERTRIARDLHDVVAHSVSVIVIQAAGARRNVRSAPEKAEVALDAIESTGREAMQELRSILGVLRTSDDRGADIAATQRVPQPNLEHLANLTAADDLPIEVDIDPELRIEDLPASTSLTAYRLVQEALTNTRRHAGPDAAVRIRIGSAFGELAVDVTDDGRGAAADTSEPGFGLSGMRERVAASGGTVEAGPRPGGGWRVSGRLPLGAKAAARSAYASGVDSTSATRIDDPATEHVG